MELASSNNARTCLCVIIFLLSICLRVSNTQEENEASRIDQDKTKPKVTTLRGPIRGVIMHTRNNRSIASFVGVPYAQPPIGNLRFRPPVPVDIWNETLDTGSDTPDCIQSPNGEIMGSEDCLHLNVFTPWLPTNQNSKLLPVMVYVFGGAFREGTNNSTSYGPEFLLDKDVVLVVPNYRLGPLGFLSTGDAESPGNWGLKDLIFALKWTRDNIEVFGGDSSRVTMFGDSSGGIAIDLLALSDSTIGLFHKYITMSGPALSTFAYQPKKSAADDAIRLGNYLGCPTNTSTALLECLRELDASKLVDTVALFLKWGQYPFVSWQPTIEPDLDGAVLTDTPANLLANGKLHDLPRIFGSIPGDGYALSGYLYSNPDKLGEFIDDFDDILPHVLNYENKVKNVSAYTSALKSYYFNNDLTANRSMILSNLTILCGDFMPKFGNHEELKRANLSSSTYVYSLEYRGTYGWSYIWASDLKNRGAVHCDELLYLFPPSNPKFQKLNATMSERDFEMVTTIVELWTSFATTGKPEIAALANNEHWSPCSSRMECLRIGNYTDLSLQVEYSESKSENRMLFLRNLDANLMLNYPPSFFGEDHPH